MGTAENTMIDDPVTPDPLDDQVTPDPIDSTKETQFEKKYKMGPAGRQLTSLATGIVSGVSGLPETMNPVSDAVSQAEADRPKSFKDILLRAGEDSLLGPGGPIIKGLYGAGKQMFGGGPKGETPEEAGERRAHGAGSMIGQTTAPFIAGEGAEAEPLASGKGLAGKVMRNEYNQLRPTVKLASRVAGAYGGHQLGLPGIGELGGAYYGPEIADALIPNRPGAFSKADRAAIPAANNPNLKINAGALADQVRAAKQAAAPPQGPKVAPWQGPLEDTTPPTGPRVQPWQGPMPKPEGYGGNPISAPPQGPVVKPWQGPLPNPKDPAAAKNPILNPQVAADGFNEAARTGEQGRVQPTPTPQSLIEKVQGGPKPRSVTKFTDSGKRIGRPPAAESTSGKGHYGGEPIRPTKSDKAAWAKQAATERQRQADWYKKSQEEFGPDYKIPEAKDEWDFGPEEDK